MIPSICGDTAFTGAYFKKILENVEHGSVLYLSLESGLLSSFEDTFGLKVLTRRKNEKTENITFEGKTIPIRTSFKLKMISTGAKILAADSEGDPSFTVFDYGKGKVFFLSCPLEKSLTLVPDAFGSASGTESVYCRFYRHIAANLNSQKAAYVKNQNIGLSEHVIDSDKRLLVLVNYDPNPVTAGIKLIDGWKIHVFIYGALEMGRNDAAVLEIIRC
jgi:hypothetical protein